MAEHKTTTTTVKEIAEATDMMMELFQDFIKICKSCKVTEWETFTCKKCTIRQVNVILDILGKRYPVYKILIGKKAN